MPPLVGQSISVQLPSGWDGHIYRRPQTDQAKTFAVLHAANFPLPPDRGDFGSNAVELMGPDHILVVLFEYDPASASTPMFSGKGPPVPLSPDQFSPTMLQRTLPGQAGTQAFFSEQGRALCLYVVLGSYDNRARLVPVVNSVLQSLNIQPG